MRNSGPISDKHEIWIINQYAVTPDLPGGTRHYDFGCELAKKGYTVRIFASDVNLSLRRHTKLRTGELFREENVNGVRFGWVKAAEYRKNDWRRVLNMLTFAANVYRVGFQLRASPRAIIGSSPHPFAAFSAWLLSRVKHSRFILELRDLWPQALIDMGGMRERSVSARLLRLLEKFLYRVADKIIILASGSRDYLLKRNVPSDKIVYIPNGVHLSNFVLGTSDGSIAEGFSRTHTPNPISLGDTRKLASDLRKRFGFDRFTIIYTGAHGPANALDTILRAAHLLRGRTDIQFVLVGDGPSKSSLLQEAKRLNLENVRFMDPVPKDKIPELLAAADAAVITLRAVDAFAYAISPNKLFDYMAAARPVICAVPGDMAKLVQDNQAGFAVEPENPEALAGAVKRMFDMSEYEREFMGQCGRKLIERHFSRERLADSLEAIL